MKLRLSAYLLVILFQFNILHCQASQQPEEPEPRSVGVYMGSACVPRGVFTYVCEYLDARSLRRAEQVSCGWLQSITTTKRLFLPADAKDREELFVNRPFAELFRRALNTPGGLDCLVAWTGFYPSHFQGVYPFNCACPEDDANKLVYEHDLTFYQSCFQRNLSRNPLSAVALFPAPVRIFEMTNEEKQAHIALLLEIMPRLKLLRVLSKESAETAMDSFCETLAQPAFLIDDPNGTNNYAFRTNAQLYIRSLRETPEVLREFVTQNFPCKEDTIHYLPAFAYSLVTLTQRDGLLEDQFRNNLHAYLRKITMMKEQNPIVATKLYTYVKLYLMSMKERTKDLSDKLAIASLLSEYFDEDDDFAELAEAGARQGIYTVATFGNLYDRNHPNARPAAVSVITKALENLREGKSSDFSSYALKLLANSGNEDDLALATMFVRTAHGAEPQNPPVDMRVCLDGKQLKVLVKHNAQEAKQVLMSHIDRQRQSLARDERACKSMLWGVHKLIQLFDDETTAKTICDELFPQAKDLPPARVTLLALLFNRLDDSDKALQCLDIVEGQLEDLDPSNIAKLAFAHAKLGNKARARELFLKSLQSILEPIAGLINKPYLTEDEQADVAAHIIDSAAVIGRAWVLEDLSFLKPYFAQFSNYFRQRDESLLIDPFLYVFNLKFNEPEQAAFFWERFSKNRALSSCERARDECEASLNLQKGELVNISQKDLYDHLCRLFTKFNKKYDRPAISEKSVSPATGDC